MTSFTDATCAFFKQATMLITATHYLYQVRSETYKTFLN